MEKNSAERFDRYNRISQGSPQESAAFRSLARLAEAKLLKLHIPQIVRRELLSYQQDQFAKNVLAVQADLHHLGRQLLPDRIDGYIRRSKKKLEMTRTELKGVR